MAEGLFLWKLTNFGSTVYGVGRGGHDDIVTQTPRSISPQEPFYSVLQYFRDVGHSYMMVDDDDDDDG